MNLLLAPNGGLALVLPSGRQLAIPISPYTGEFLARILYDAEHGAAPAKGYIGSYPTQAAIDAWQRQHAAERKAVLEGELGIDIDGLEITL